MKASALHCGMEYLEPLVFEGINSSQLENYKQALVERLKNKIELTKIQERK